MNYPDAIHQLVQKITDEEALKELYERAKELVKRSRCAPTSKPMNRKERKRRRLDQEEWG